MPVIPEEVFQQTQQAIGELLIDSRPHLNPVRLLVIGGSTSEIAGGVIGHSSTYELGEAVVNAALEVCAPHGIDLAFQCCEHLNRALIMERAAAEKRGYETVCVVPQVKAGGSLATAAYAGFENPVAVEQIAADAGLDIGLTLIGMHLRKVAVPVRLEHNRIGEAFVVAARTRPKFIGGVRAVYDEELL